MDSKTAIRQFSSGRAHVLGLSDSGRIWAWNRIHSPGAHVRFLHLEIREQSEETPDSLYGRVRQVRAGWTLSSAYIHGTGIVLWSPGDPNDENNDSELLLVSSPIEVPNTDYQRVKDSSRESEEQQRLGAEVGEVLNYILLEHYVVFVTDIGKVFAARIRDENAVTEILELRQLRNETGTTSDVQGAFRSFAVFKNGEVITSDQDYIHACWDARTTNREQTDIEGLKRIPALQNNDVISVSFGDFHFLALHSNGKITAYGKELQGCGALGLGGDGVPEGFARGIRYLGLHRDGQLLPHAYTTGREVWFQPEKRKWIMWMMAGGRDTMEANERMRWAFQESNVQGDVSEWFEQEGRDWDKDPELKEADDDGLGAHFALSVSAAGWHSAAIVLVNEDLEERVRQRCIVQDDSGAAAEASEEPQPPIANSHLRNVLRANETRNSARGDPTHGRSPGAGLKYVWADKSFPRPKLSDGREMPGTVPFDEWKSGRPPWQVDIGV